MDVDNAEARLRTHLWLTNLVREEIGRRRGREEGKRDALLAVLAARGLSPTEAERTSIAALSDSVVLDRCIQAAVTAVSVGAALVIARRRRRRRTAPARGPEPRPVKHPSRRR